MRKLDGLCAKVRQSKKKKPDAGKHVRSDVYQDSKSSQHNTSQTFRFWIRVGARQKANEITVRLKS